ncbi:MAG TPA: glycosyltransferase family 1 protein [Bryobacteraceae bacterium]|nr:glycosyltransferase family 1 protein [Bryobacteraceae bacterium]
MFTVNGRFKSHLVTGMQRYAIEVCNRFESSPKIAHPKQPLKGIKGHLWEQVVLPKSLKGLLWSPCNTGPIYTRRQVLTIHDLIPLDNPEWYSSQYSFLYRALMPELIRRAEHIIAVSEYTKQRIIQIAKTDEKKITVIANGIGDEFRPQTSENITRVTTSLGIPEGPYLLSVCSLEPRKNLARLLSAWSLVNGRGLSATLVVTGAKGRSAVFKAAQFGSIPDRVIFTGYVPDQDLPALYSGARAFVYPSLYEGFGLPVLEAAASGTQVIASNSTSIPEVAGPSTILVDPLSTSDIAAAMERVLDQPADWSAVSSGREHARRYTWDSSAKTTEQLLLSYC